MSVQNEKKNPGDIVINIVSGDFINPNELRDLLDVANLEMDLEEFQERPPLVNIVAHVDGKLVGYCAGAPLYSQTCFMIANCVHPSYQWRGISLHMIELLSAAFFVKGYRLMDGITQSLRAVSLYENWATVSKHLGYHLEVSLDEIIQRAQARKSE